MQPGSAGSTQSCSEAQLSLQVCVEAAGQRRGGNHQPSAWGTSGRTGGNSQLPRGGTWVSWFQPVSAGHGEQVPTPSLSPFPPVTY